MIKFIVSACASLIMIGLSYSTIAFFTPEKLSQTGAILQKSRNDCGLASAKNVLVELGKNPDAIDTLLKTSVDGVTMLDIKSALSKQGLHCIGYKTTLGELATLGLPAIAHINDNHFVVVETVEGESVVLIDPSVGRMKYRASVFEEKWDGIALCVAKKP